ncbi:hypothetical protein F2P79_011179 [Pimephales promelas]|nr:hypothetical protein F2P79_011179 [Pimephales promelas]
MRICAIGRLNLRKTSRRDDIDEGLQLVFGNGCGSKTRFAQRFINKFKAKSGDTIGSKLKILQQIQNDKSNINAERTAFFIMAYHYFSRRTTMIFTRHLLTVMTMKICPTLK